jgi:hypothetical protein
MERIKALIFAIGTATCRSGDASATLEKAKRQPGGSLTLVRHNQQTRSVRGMRSVLEDVGLAGRDRKPASTPAELPRSIGVS